MAAVESRQPRRGRHLNNAAPHSSNSSSVFVAAWAVAFLICCRTVFELPAAGCVLAFSTLSRCSSIRGPRFSVPIPTQQHLRMTFSYPENFNSEDEEEDDDDDDESIDPASLGDWRTFRRNLLASFADNDAAATQSAEEPFTTTSKATKGTSSSSSSSYVSPRQTPSVSKENEDILRTQCEKLAQEYVDGVWAHPTSTPEVGGLVVRLPLEAEIFRNHRHSLTGRQLRQQHQDVKDSTRPVDWYKKAQRLVEHGMLAISEQAGDDGQLDATTLNEESSELLQLFLDNQETWQEVCLVLERDEESGTATTLVLNRPMALKLTENLAQLVCFGAYGMTGGGVSLYSRRRTSSFPSLTPQQRRRDDADLMIKFLQAFGQECAVYIGGPDDQDQAAEIIHGIANLPGAREIAQGTGIYVGGDLHTIINGVLQKTYKPMDFRFFVGRHTYDESTLDVNVLLGKYQPVACARSLALKQCISLPKPLWHEVLELSGGEMKEISRLELLKRDDLKFQIVDDDDEDDDDEDDGAYFEDASTLDEVDGLETLDDDEEDFFAS